MWRTLSRLRATAKGLRLGHRGAHEQWGGIPSTVRRDLNERIVRLCVLDDPARWSAYLAVRTAARALTRAEVAEEVGISVRLAAFHLEKLLSEGFVEATYDRDEGSAGVGHPAKRYRPTDLELEVSIPPRRYELAAEILAEALDEGSGDPPQRVLADVAGAYGQEVGRRARARSGDNRLLSALRVVGYEPAVADDDVVLRNCPFRHVAKARPDVICQMNVAFVAGVLAGTKSRSLHAVLSPSAARCCVIVAPAR
jgi:predicted ArsR family transcriptional regulator